MGCELIHVLWGQEEQLFNSDRSIGASIQSRTQGLQGGILNVYSTSTEIFTTEKKDVELI